MLLLLPSLHNSTVCNSDSLRAPAAVAGAGAGVFLGWIVVLHKQRKLVVRRAGVKQKEEEEEEEQNPLAVSDGM